MVIDNHNKGHGVPPDPVHALQPLAPLISIHPHKNRRPSIRQPHSLSLPLFRNIGQFFDRRSEVGLGHFLHVKCGEHDEWLGGMLHHIWEILGRELLKSRDAVVLEKGVDDGGGSVGTERECRKWFLVVVFDH
jgi:hypothetical protein